MRRGRLCGRSRGGAWRVIFVGAALELEGMPLWAGSQGEGPIEPLQGTDRV